MCRWRRIQTSILPLCVPLALASCGGSGSSPSAPSRPTHPVAVVVFYDENGNGSWDVTENARIPEVVVEVAGHTGRTEASGRAVIDGVPEGTYPVTVRAETLPAFYQPLAAARPVVSSPQTDGADVRFPLTLPIGSNRPGVYMGFGDSITVGDGSSSGNGYRDILEARLQGYFGTGLVVDGGKSGSKSNVGAKRIADEVAYARPAYTLILYGTNDWNDLACKVNFPCFTVDSLRSMVRSVKAAQSLPVVGTIIPVNPNHEYAADRNDWVSKMNELIRPMAQQEGALLADLHAAFMKAGDLTRLFDDKVHPNDEGYRIIAEEFFRAIVTPGSSSGSSGLESLAWPSAPLLHDPSSPEARDPLWESRPRRGGRSPQVRSVLASSLRFRVNERLGRSESGLADKGEPPLRKTPVAPASAPMHSSADR